MARPPRPAADLPPRDWTTAERRLWTAFRGGERLDLRSGDQAVDDPADGPSWGAERQIRAQAIALLLLAGPPANDGRVRRLALAGARIVGPLDVSCATVPVEIDFLNCSFDSSLTIEHASIPMVYLHGSHLPGLNAEALHCAGLDMRDCQVSGDLWLQAGDLAIDLNLDRARVGGVINGNLLTIGSWFNGREGLRVGKGLTLDGARINGVDLREARLDTEGLSAELMKANAVWLAGARLERRLNLRGTTVAQELDLDSVTVHGPPAGSAALCLDQAQATRLQLGVSRTAVPSVSLRDARIGTLVDRPDHSPPTDLEGLVYDRLDPLPPRSAALRLRWLRNGSNRYLPQPYEQLAAAYRRLGQDQDARTVLIAKQRHHQSTLPVPMRAFGLLQDATVGYGYRPIRAALWLLLLTCAGTVLFALNPAAPAQPGHGLAFHPLVYTLDLLLPVVDFGQEHAFTPVGAMQWFAYSLIAAGWILATSALTGLTRLLNRG